jgi:pimeloyl-ACP methyl ester carboxylesterase
VHAVISELKLKHVILFGHSMSGEIILGLDNKYPSDVIAIAGVDNLNEPGSPMNEPDQRETDTFFYNMSRNFETAVNGMASDLFHPTTDTTIVRRVKNDVLNSDTAIAVSVLKAMMDKWQQEKQVMQTLSHKLYMINSDARPVNADSLNKYCSKGYQLFTVPSTGHYPMIEKPAEFNKAIEELVRDL